MRSIPKKGELYRFDKNHQNVCVLVTDVTDTSATLRINKVPPLTVQRVFSQWTRSEISLERFQNATYEIERIA